MAVEEPPEKGGEGQSHGGRDAGLLHAEPLALYQRHVDGHVPISLCAQEEADSIYLIYHDGLGNNGIGTELHRKIVALLAYVDHGEGDEDAP